MEPAGQDRYINITVTLDNGRIIIKSKGTVYEVYEKPKPAVYVLPKELIEQDCAWDDALKKYVVLTDSGHVIYRNSTLLPSQLDITIRYSGKNVEKFIQVLRDVLARYYKPQPVLRLPWRDKQVRKLAVFLARMGMLQDISDL
jgi:hypothetical protein